MVFSSLLITGCEKHIMKDEIDLYIEQEEMARFIQWCDEHPDEVYRLTGEWNEPSKPKWSIEIWELVE